MYSIQGSRLPSNAVFKVTHPSPATLNQIVDKITMLTELMTIAEASCKVSGQNDNELEVEDRKAVVRDMRQKKVLVLGAGKVAKSLSEYLGGRTTKESHHIVVGSNIQSEADAVAAAALSSER